MKFFFQILLMSISMLLVIESTPVTIARSPEEGNLFEGDILGVEKDEKGAYINPYRFSEPWPNGEVPYFIDPGARYSYSELRGIEAGLDHLEEATKLDGKQVVTFIELSSEREAKSYPAAVRVIRGNGCYSYVGMRRDMGIQNVSIGTGCTNLGNVAHEFMHALGFDHEQSRPDRDDYVNIYYDNIEKGTEHNFDKHSNSNSVGITVGLLEFPYDYGSIMHYGAYYFSRNGQPTILPKKSGVEIGNRAGLSYQDSLEINAAYKSKSIDELLSMLQQATSTRATTKATTHKVTTIPTTQKNVNSGSLRLVTPSIFTITSFYSFLSFLFYFYSFYERIIKLI